MFRIFGTNILYFQKRSRRWFCFNIFQFRRAFVTKVMRGKDKFTKGADSSAGNTTVADRSVVLANLNAPRGRYGNKVAPAKA